MKKHHWHVFRHEKLFEKQPLPHCQIPSKLFALGHTKSFIINSILQLAYSFHTIADLSSYQLNQLSIVHAWIKDSLIRKNLVAKHFVVASHPLPIRTLQLFFSCPCSLFLYINFIFPLWFYTKFTLMIRFDGLGVGFNLVNEKKSCY
jgi:hypothetical protein